MIYEDLLMYNDIKKEIERINERIAELEHRLCNPKSPVLDDIPIRTSSMSSSLEAGVLKLIELKDMYKDLVDKLADRQMTIERSINELVILEPLERDLIRFRYFDSMTWEAIAEKIGYSNRHVFRIHNTILEKLRNS